MKYLKILLLSLIFFTLIFSQKINATIIGPTSASYKEGVYTINNVQNYTVSAKLITPDKITSLSIVDANGNQKIFRRFNKAYVPTSKIVLEENDSIIIIGSGEISLNFFE